MVQHMSEAEVIIIICFIYDFVALKAIVDAIIIISYRKQIMYIEMSHQSL